MNYITDKRNKIKWVVKELIKTLSSEKSFFSSKRIKTTIAFLSGEVTLLSFFFYHLSTLPTMEAIAIATIFFSVAGFVLTKTEQAKSDHIESNNDNNLEDSK